MESYEQEKTFGGGGYRLDVSNHQKGNPHVCSPVSNGGDYSLARSIPSGIATTQENYVRPCSSAAELGNAPGHSSHRLDDRVNFRARFLSTGPLASSSGDRPNILKAKKSIMEVFGVDSSYVSFIPLNDNHFRIETTNPLIAEYLKECPYLEDVSRPSQNRGVCNLTASHNCPVEQILEELQLSNPDTGIIKVEKMKANNVIITFSDSLPADVAYLNRKRSVRLYYSFPYRCRKCQAFGHLTKWCSQEARCSKCSKAGHSETECKAPPNCRSCKAPHRPDSPNCPRWQQEIRIKKRMASDGISYQQAKQALPIKTIIPSRHTDTTKPRTTVHKQKTWANVAAKSVNTKGPQSVGTQTYGWRSIGTQFPIEAAKKVDFCVQTDLPDTTTNTLLPETPKPRRYTCCDTTFCLITVSVRYICR